MYNRAKWEVYKLNTVSLNEYQANYLINHNISDSLRQEYENLRNELKRSNKRLSKNRKAVEILLGKDNVKDFIETELELYERDSSEIFKGEEIFLSLFPKREEDKYWSKPTAGLYLSLIHISEPTRPY